MQDTPAHRPSVGLELFELLARAGHAWSQYMLAEAYETGEHTPQDFRRAIQWYQSAAQQGHEFAETQLDQLLEQIQQGPDGVVYV